MAALTPLTGHAAAAATASASAAGPSPKLIKAAHEFEAQMMKELLQPMTGADADADPLFSDSDDASGSGLGLDSGSGSGGALSDFASQSLGQALSQRGGFGIADRIVHQLAPAAGTHPTPHSGVNVTAQVTQSPHGNTVMRKTQ